ncbi:hypothetical protein KY359_03420 [Candidatus Woesearchaeota archaeon]|nr:hypothetical protein [Candidatus Woesearchaeota archaeon]
MKRIETHDELVDLLRRDVEETEMKRIVVQAGHFPLNYDSGSKSLVEDLDIWGEFSEYTFELGCEAAGHALGIGKGVELIILCDDHAYSPAYSEARSAKKVDGPAWQRMAGRLFRSRSGEDAELPEQYRRIMDKYDLPQKLVQRQDHGKRGRNDCLYHSENILRNSDRDIDNNCARAYLEMLESGAIDIQQAYLVSFVPHPCRGHICFAIEELPSTLSASHIFMETEMNPTRADMYACEKGVIYRKDEE